ncbi:alpha/beta hydrolase [Nocardia sp. NBC_00565]|uniref:alpha/beta hydrolase n=1 Tax=Nocardia sp. NBC_00565 TaxID=2975993 RepID=UPI002E819AD6|nr:alpha/beta hydrolase [Nocardia sp. NBC_00565]WUC04722.1 alpha/beta hydrolase [Nocardia sp. NBC_00565]
MGPNTSDEGFHPDLRRHARFLPQQLVSARTVPILRALQGLPGLRRPRGVEVVSLGSGVRVRVHRPSVAATRTPALLWIHGGGYVMGCAQQDDRLCRRFAHKLGIVVAAVDYRLAPEHPYPEPLEDCYSALRWLADQPGVDSTRVAIGGGSAGGGLAAALALLVRDRGPITPILQLLTYPMLDDRTVAAAEVADYYRLWNVRSNLWGWASYLGNADPEVAVPARCADLTGTAPAWIGVGSYDLFHGEDLAYAERLRSAGVGCTVQVVDGAFHAFDLIAPSAPVSRSFFASQCDSLRTAFAIPDI